MAIYFFDKNQTLIKIVPESATFEAIQTQELDDDSLLKDTLSVTVKGDEKLLDAEYMAVKSYTGNAQTFDMYRIVTDTTPDKTMSFTGMSLAPYELNGHIIQDLRPVNHSLSYTLNRVLDGTDWRVGYIEDGLSNITTTFYYISAKEALKELQSLVGCEFVFKVEISGQKITDKWIEVYKEMGNRTKKRFNYGTNALTVVRETNKADIYTALIGRGKGEEVSSAEDNESGQAGYGRKITFEDIEWSTAKGNPLNKPVGQYYLELPQATQAYGIKNIDGTIKARVGIVDFDDEEDKDRLINLTYQQLLVSSRPKVLFKTTVANIGATGIGDTVTIHRHDLNIHYQTRVRKIVRNKLNDNKTQIELGDAVVTASTKQTKQNNATIKNLNQELERVKADVTASQNSADGKNTIFYGSAEPERQRTGDTWYRPHPSIAGETQMLVWNGNAWELVIDTSDLTTVSREVKDAIDRADEAKGLAVSEAESALALAKADATAKANAIKEQISGEVNTAISTAEDAKALAVTEAENALAQAKADATAKANAVKEQVSGEVNNAIEASEDAKQTAIDNYNNAVAEAERLVGEQTTTFDTKFGEIEDGVSELSNSVSDVDARAEAIKKGLGITDTTLSNQQITDQIRADYDTVKQNANTALTNADTAVNDFNDFKVGYDDFIANQFNPAFTTSTNALSLAQQNEGLFYSANLIDEVTGQSNVYTKAEIDGTNGYVSKSAFTQNAESVSSELERVEGVALASGANINLLVRKDEQAGKYLDTGGVIKDSADYAISTHKINVTSGEKLTFSQIFARNFRYAFYKSDGTFLSFGMSASQKFTITVPTNASYMLPSYSTSENYPKIERGEVKTQWTLAPQDQVNQSTVNYLTSKVEQTPGMITEALISYTPTDSLDDTVSSYLSNNTTKTAGAINTKLTDYQTKDTLDSSVANLYTNTNSATAQSISTKLEAYQTTASLDTNVANLFTNTNSATAKKIDSSLTAIKGLIPTTIDNQNMLDGTSDVWLQGDVSNNWNMYAYSGPTAKISALPNSTYIVSADVIKEYNDIGLFIFEYQNSTLIKENYVTGLWRYPTDKVRRSFKIKTGANTNNISVGFRFNASNIQTKFKYRRVQLEHSEIETDWKPSFKNTVALSDYTTFKNDTTDTATLHAKKLSSITSEGIVTSSSVNQTADGIAQRVAKVDEYGNVAYTNTDIKLDSIVSTVANGTYISNLIQTSNLLQSTITSFIPNQNILKGTDFANEENTMGDVIEYGRKPRFSKADYFSYGRIATIDIPETSGDANLGFAVKLPTKDKWYTLSFYGLANWLGTAGVDFYVTDPYKTLKNYKATLLTEYDLATYRIQVTVKATVANAIIYVRPQGNRFSANYNNIVFWGVKLEGDEVATKWGDNVSSSKITQLENSIDLKVSNKDLLSQINVQANGVLITSGTNKLNITPTTTYIEDATIKSAMIDTVNVKQLTGITADFTSMVTGALTANTITSTMINANDAMFTKLFATKLATDKLVAQGAWITDANIVSLDAGTITSGTIDSGLIDAEYIVTNGLSTNVVESKHIQSSTGLIDKIFADEALINQLTSKDIFARNIKAIEIDASKITSGELESARIKSKDVVTDGLTADAIQATHIKAEAGLVGKLFSQTAYIEELTNKTVFTEKIQAININADKITTGTLDAGKVSVVNLDANNITANKTEFIKTNWNDLNAFTQIDASGIHMLGSGTWRRTYISPTGFRMFNGSGANNKAGAIGYFKSSTDLGGGINNPLKEDFMWQDMQRHTVGIGVNDGHLLSLGYQNPGASSEDGYNPALTIDPKEFGLVRFLTEARFNSDLQVDGNLTLPGGDYFTTYNGLYLYTSYWTVMAKTGVRFFVGDQKKLHIGGNVELGTTLDMAGNTITGQSDYRLKKDIETLNSNDLDKLTGVRMVSYKWIDPERPKGTHIGFIAQELKEVYPELITANDDGILSINNSELAMAHIHATQELNAKVDAHISSVDDEVADLKAQIASLQDELALLKGA